MLCRHCQHVNKLLYSLCLLHRLCQTLDSVCWVVIVSLWRNPYIVFVCCIVIVKLWPNSCTVFVESSLSACEQIYILFCCAVIVILWTKSLFCFVVIVILWTHFYIDFVLSLSAREQGSIYVYILVICVIIVSLWTNSHKVFVVSSLSIHEQSLI